MPEAQPQFPDTSGYATRWVNEAARAGCLFFGWSGDLKGPKYQVTYGMLCSPGRDCFVIIGVGKVFGMPVRGTSIYTRAIDGRVFYTTDHQSGVDIDLTRSWRGQLTEAQTFTGLWNYHQNLLRDLNVIPQPFLSGREIAEYKTLREERFQAMARRGLIAFTDASASYWRYTSLGALKWTAVNYTIGMLRGFSGGRTPRCA
jgi:hypothetical protein